jgi:phosphohistidine phosphatase SixA
VIYLLRHGDAEAGDGDDASRRLTVKGKRQAEAAGHLRRPKELAAISAAA